MIFDLVAFSQGSKRKYYSFKKSDNRGRFCFQFDISCLQFSQVQQLIDQVEQALGISLRKGQDESPAVSSVNGEVAPDGLGAYSRRAVTWRGSSSSA